MFEIFERLSVSDDLLGDPVLTRDDGNIASLLSPHDVRIMKLVKL